MSTGKKTQDFIHIFFLFTSRFSDTQIVGLSTLLLHFFAMKVATLIIIYVFIGILTYKDPFNIIEDSL